ncbi:hypothetical protein NL676_017542 [Syzygium grande]|nr:hypothetical protein NL676_017542 [Syzygium grande]
MGSLGLSCADSHHFKPLDPEKFRTQAHQMVDFTANYYEKVETYPVLSQVQPGDLLCRLPESAPVSTGSRWILSSGMFEAVSYRV